MQANVSLLEAIGSLADNLGGAGFHGAMLEAFTNLIPGDEAKPITIRLTARRSVCTPLIRRKTTVQPTWRNTVPSVRSFFTGRKTTDPA